MIFRKYCKLVWCMAAIALVASHSTRAEDLNFDDDYADAPEIADPLEPMNRVFYHLNDKLYFWVLNPVATGYDKVFPSNVRVGIRNVFDNVGMPKRVVNCALQGRFSDSGEELARFGINSTIGILGWRDIAKERWGLTEHKEDTGQTLGAWGIGPGIYLTLPVFGPSNARDAVGLVGDMFLDPVHYVPHFWVRVTINAEDKVNRLSLMLGEYERSKAAAIDHYLSLRDVYQQYRARMVGE